MKVVVAYSGGLDTSVIVKWVKETYNAEVIAYCADVGQEEELTGLDRKAIATGASKCYIDDIREEFAKDFIFPMMQANAIYEGTYLLGTSIARPLIGKKLICKVSQRWKSPECRSCGHIRSSRYVHGTSSSDRAMRQ